MLRHRFGSAIGDIEIEPERRAALSRMARRASQRAYRTDRLVDRDLIRLLCAVALCSPTKSDLQQRDIIIVDDRDQRRRVTSLLDDWAADAPVFLVFCGNNRRQRQMHAWRNRPFVNDHLDAFFNAAVDAAIALSAFVIAAEAVGLGCCPISTIRDHAQEVSDILALPSHVFPVAGMTVGWPLADKPIALRLPLDLTLHHNRFDDTAVREQIDGYDRRRAEVQPYRKQRDTEEFGVAEQYGWSEDKVRQYSEPLRTDFGSFVRAKGFDLS